MTAPTPAAPAQEPTTPAAPAVTPEPPTLAEPAPPWGDPANFDPEKAWKLIEGLKADKEKLSAVPRMSDEQKQQLAEYQRLVEASKTEQQRQAEAVAAATKAAETAQAEAIRYRVAAMHGIPAEDFDLLGSGTEDEITARAVKIAAKNAAATPPPPVGAPQTRPVEQLRPGATPAGVQSEDDVIYQRLFGAPAPQ